MRAGGHLDRETPVARVTPLFAAVFGGHANAVRMIVEEGLAHPSKVLLPGDQLGRLMSQSSGYSNTPAPTPTPTPRVGADALAVLDTASSASTEKDPDEEMGVSAMYLAAQMNQHEVVQILMGWAQTEMEFEAKINEEARVAAEQEVIEARAKQMYETNKEVRRAGVGQIVQSALRKAT